MKFCLALIAASAVAALFPADAASQTVCNCRTEGEWEICESRNFTVWSTLPRGQTTQTVNACEQIRSQLVAAWFANSQSPEWSSRCVIVLHASASNYATAVGQPGTRSVGCTTLQVAQHRISFRRIDIRCERSNWRESALPHELTHVVLADRLGDRPMPLWADEGLAVLSEPPSTREKRATSLLDSMRRGAVVPLRELMTRESLPEASRRDCFYSESAFLVADLIDRKSPADFLAFLERAAKIGYDAALRQSYGVDGVAELERIRLARRQAAVPGSFIEVTGKAALAVHVSADQSSSVSQIRTAN